MSSSSSWFSGQSSHRRPAAVFAAAVATAGLVASCTPVFGGGPGSPTTSPSSSASSPASPTGPSTTQPVTPTAVPPTAPTAVPPTAPTGVPTAAPSATPASPPPTTPGTGNPFAGAAFYDSPSTQADTVVAGLRQSRPADAAILERISETATGFWVGDWYGAGQVRSVVAEYTAAARAADEVPVLVVYAIPVRDCGGYSAGGIGSPEGYRAWLAEVAAGLGTGRAAVVLEPDAIAGIDCLDAGEAQTRYSLLQDAARTLTTAGASVYLDAGHASWLSPTEAANRLRLAGVADVRGFALNTSNFETTAASTSYGSEVSRLLGGAHFVIDTSRNGLGPAANSAWCNPAGRALGVPPTAATGSELVDALLWVKAPGESDGTCNGGPPAGQFWVDYALGLAGRAVW